MRRKAFTQRQIIDVLIWQGVVILCGCGCGQPILKGSDAIREHLHQLALGGKDVPENCQYWLKSCSHTKSFGTKATSAGSDANRRAKVKRLNKAKGGYARAASLTAKRRKEIASAAAKARWRKRKIASRPFPKGRSRAWTKSG